MVVRSVHRASSLLFAFGLAACPPAAAPGLVVEPLLDVPRLSGDGGSEPVASGVRFGRAAPVVGARWAVTVEARSSSADPQGGMQLSEYHSAYTVEVLSLDGPAASRVRLAFSRNVQRYQGLDRATAIDGKTYVVDATAPHVRDSAGGVPPEEEVQRVLDVFPDLGTRTQIDQVLPEAPMMIGDERHDLAGAILRVVHPRAWTLNHGTAVLARADSSEAVFTIGIDATGRGGLRMEVKGEAHVRLRDARLMSLSLDGTYEPSQGGVRGAPDQPEGAFSLRRTVTDP